jgi:pilus assembly protein CpaB
MRNKRLLIVLACAITFGLTAAYLVSSYMRNYAQTFGSLDDVVVARVNIPVGTRIQRHHLITAKFPPNARPDGTFATPDKLVGRVAAYNILAREPVTDFKLAPEGSSGGLSAIIPEGFRAITVKVDEVVGVSGFILPGTLVDVVVVIDPPPGKESAGGRISKIVLQNIKVLANGQNIDRPQNDREADRVRAVTLQVTPEQAEKLALASNEGKLQLVMRNSIDQEDARTPGANKLTLLSGERALIQPEPGSLKSEQPQATPPPASTAPAGGTRRPRPRVEGTFAPVAEHLTEATPTVTPTPPKPLPTKSAVELIEGAKKRTVEFP